MPDNVEIANVVGICFQHHVAVTEDKASVSYADGIFSWSDDKIDNQPLDPHPQIHGVEHVHASEEDRALCPTCGRRMPRPKVETPSEQPKQRATWAIAVPVEARENGADVLDELLDAARDKLDEAGLSYGEGSKVKYYQLTTALALFVQHAELILSDE